MHPNHEPSIINRSHRPVLAVDIGGTKILTAIVSPAGQVMAHCYELTRASEGPRAVIERLFACLDLLISRKNGNTSQFEAIALGTAGPLEQKRGLVTSSPHLPGWRNVPLRDIVYKRYHLDTYMINDAQAAALGEQQLGAGKGTQNLIFLTISTGIGGGIVINGRLFTGHDGSAGEIGHMTVDINGPQCNCGNHGCLEVMASGTAVARDACARLTRGDKSQLIEMVHGDLSKITAKEIQQAAEEGDTLSREVIDRAAFYLGVGLASLVDIFNPEVIVIGGGMSRLGGRLLVPARKVVRQRAFRLPARTVRILRARLGIFSGVQGAAIFALHQQERGEGET
jgi:glucokinase